MLPRSDILMVLIGVRSHLKMTSFIGRTPDFLKKGHDTLIPRYLIHCRHFVRHRIDHLLSSDSALRDKTAIVDVDSKLTFNELRIQSETLSAGITDVITSIYKSGPGSPGTDPINDRPTVAFLATNRLSTVVTLFACWLSGCIAVPISSTNPKSEWERVLRDSKAWMLVAPQNDCLDLVNICTNLNVPLHEFNLGDNTQTLPETSGMKKVSKNVGALLLYTSGTMSPAKGVVITHGVLQARMASLFEAWEIQKNDALLNFLPFNDTSGLVGGLLCPLSVGATVQLVPNEFDVGMLWESLTTIETSPSRANVIMADPSIYQKILEHYDANYKDKTSVKAFISAVCKDRIRFMISSLTALPDTTARQWTKVTGHQLIECYGMAETGTVIATPIQGSSKNGFFGKPLPKVEVCIAKPNKYARLGYDTILSDNTTGETPTLTPRMDAESGELYIRGPNVFHTYWNLQEETKNAFTRDGWFKSGDTAQYSNGSYRILGRTSVDIIKSGGFQISALDVERHLLQHMAIAECAVFGMPDIVWGQKVASVVILKTNRDLTEERLRDWCKAKMPAYCVPAVIEFVTELPRNSLNKINKKLLSDIFTKM